MLHISLTNNSFAKIFFQTSFIIFILQHNRSHRTIGNLNHRELIGHYYLDHSFKSTICLDSYSADLVVMGLRFRDCYQCTYDLMEVGLH